VPAAQDKGAAYPDGQGGSNNGGDSCAEGLLGESGGGIGVPSRGGGCGSDDG
jgi:hypothetical protein